MILLLGGTSDSIEIARLLVNEGLPTIFSMVTQAFMNLPQTPLLIVRRGAMDQTTMIESIVNNKIDALVDATHPYATEVTRNAVDASRKTGVQYFRLTRKPVVDGLANVIFAKDHQEAARKAVNIGGLILLTIGVRNLEIYSSICSKAGLPFVVRALPNESSLKILKDLGIPSENTITGLGPFSYEHNVRTIRQFGVKTLITKDSGTRGGTVEKIRAAQDEGCNIIVVKRPPSDATRSFDEPQRLVNAVKNYLITISSKREGVASRTML